MARYRKYPTYEPKIEIDKSWADKLMKLNAQQLTLLIQQLINFQGELSKVSATLWDEICFANHANYVVSIYKIKLQQGVDQRSFGLRKALIGNSKAQEAEMRAALYSDQGVKNEINKVMQRRLTLNKVRNQWNKLVKDINFEILADSDFKQELIPEYQFTESDFYEETWGHDGAPERALQIHLNKVKKSLYEIRKQINKKEKSAKLASYEDKSRNVGQSLMSSMKTNLKSPYHCPYCNKKTAKTKLHVDHINPVSNGGLSVVRNLVPVCSECNLDKSDLSLRAFCKKNKLDFESICDILESMGKFI